MKGERADKGCRGGSAQSPAHSLYSQNLQSEVGQLKFSSCESFTLGFFFLYAVAREALALKEELYEDQLC